MVSWCLGLLVPWSLGLLVRAQYTATDRTDAAECLRIKIQNDAY